MELNNALLTAIKAVSFVDLNVKKHYKQMRNTERRLHPFDAEAHSFADLLFTAQESDGTLRSVGARLFYPESSCSDDLVLYFHGGGWVTGDVESYSNACAAYADALQRMVLSVEYRLAPEFPFPCGLDDCLAVIQGVITRSQADRIPIGYGRVILAGDSAGANLCAAASLFGVQHKLWKPDAQILLYPAVYNDYSERSPYPSVQECGTDYFLTAKRVSDYMELYAATPEDYQNPYFAPMLSTDLSGQPNTLVITAEFDPLRDEGEAYAARLAQAGGRVDCHRIERILHGFFQLPPYERPVCECFSLSRQFLDAADKEVTSCPFNHVTG